MLEKSLRILNFDDGPAGQPGLLSRYENRVIDFKDLGPSVRFWINKKNRRLVSQRLEGSSKSAITFLGSGDFHHISEILIDKFKEEISVIIFDFHPDWDTSWPSFGCGSWVSRVIDKKNVAKIILLGVSSQDISSFDIHSGNLASLKNDRVEIYPYAHPPSKTFLKKIPQNVSISVKREGIFNTIFWRELYRENLEVFLPDILKRISTKKVYVSIDKDCLRPDFAKTNWEEGKMGLNELLLCLKIIKERFDIAGLDITGDYSPIRLKGIIKNVASYLDHPKSARIIEKEGCDFSGLNQETNIRIVRLLTGAD